jgi:protein gp37
MGKTTISWTQETWNPVRGCSRISPGCVNCYAERMAARFCDAEYDQHSGILEERQPFHGFATRTPSGPRWTGKVELIPSMLDVPLKRKKPTTYFVNSMSDLFHEGLADEDIDRVFAVMALCPQHTFQVLTKRADRMREYACKANAGSFLDRCAGEKYLASFPFHRRPIWPLPSVWIGVSVEDQQRKSRIEMLRETPAAVRFVSFEPLLEDLGEINLHGINLAIWGGESGPGARPCDVQWIRNGMGQARRDDCRNFVKQLGAHAHRDEGMTLHLKDPKGGDMSEWEHDLRVREMPTSPSEEGR